MSIKSIKPATRGAKNGHTHEFVVQRSGVKTCACGAWRHKDGITPIVEKRAAGHTPGPWEVRNYTIHALDDKGLSRGVIAETWDSVPESQERANAALIAAAPSMIEALKAVAELDNQYASADSPIPADLAVMVHRAIARAEGRQ